MLQFLKDAFSSLAKGADYKIIIRFSSKRDVLSTPQAKTKGQLYGKAAPFGFTPTFDVVALLAPINLRASFQRQKEVSVHRLKYFPVV